MLYAARVALRYTEEEFWGLTPKKLLSQLRVHREIESIKNGEELHEKKIQGVAYIDQIPGW